MKVLVTGSNGLLGQKLTDYYKKQADIQLIATARGEDRYPDKTGYTYESLDITQYEEVKTILAKHKPDVVINTAAMTNVDACESDHAGCDALNVDAVKYLVTECNANGAHLVHVSTDFIFDGTHGPVTEDEKPNPLSYYGRSKYLAEMMVREHCASWSILRTVLVFGVVSDMSRSNIVLWAKGNLEQGKTLNVVGDQFRTPTLAEDLAQGCALAAAKKAKGIYNISGSDFMSVFDLVYRVASYWKLDKSLLNLSTSEGIKQPAKRPPITGFIIDKARKELGYKPHTFEEGLALLDEQLKGK
ncbi:dTDP-4-dehydrorhamnose reductase [Bacteroidetes bacterium UKL13-3]|jgi:dTDP-4-dehydrorhamnose reductase|nr:dTDP-4-dehydrorhamnose reductase [Bacteroidetes bacterium UKL13-3]HCP93851.1 NAD(P)-dependent oxidoreductase [Bacteroidota bacterium]